MPKPSWKNPAGDAVTSAETHVHRIKLVAPSVAFRSVPRTEIAELVARSAGAKLVLFRAPAGLGKTTAMQQYLDHLQSIGTATAWLTLDPLDNDFRRLLIHLIAAFDQVLSSRDAALQSEAIEPATSDLDQLPLDLMDRIAGCEHRFTLFIDEFETVSNRAIDDLLRLILSRMPPGGQLAIASRKTPDLQLGRLRAQGQLVEVDHLRLRFSREEAATLLLTHPGLSLSEDDITKLHSATEGWPAVLWLAATAMENREHPESFIAGFSGSNAAVVEYLAEDVLFRQPDDVQSFLLKTSILGELNKALCDAVCGREDSDVLLHRFEHSNVCVTTLDSERRLYRYHGLFASFLRNQLGRLYPDEIPGLHLKAARWYEAAGRWIPAIEHALTSGEAGYALSLLDAHADSLLFQGRFGLLARWLDTLPRESLDAKPRLRIAHIWGLTFTRRSAEALRLLDAFTSGTAANALAEDVANELSFLRPFILLILDQHAEGIWIAGETLLKTSGPENFSYNILTMTLATWKLAANRYAEAIALLNYTSHERAGAETSFPTVYAICLEGRVDQVQCRVRQAIAHFRVALGEAAARHGSRSIGKSIAAIYLAESLYEIDELHEAEQLLALYLPIALEYAMPDTVIISHILQARIAHDRGDVDHAFRRLSELEYFGRHSKLPRLRAAAQLERARIALLSDDVAEAQVHYERASNPEAWSGLRGMIMPANDVETLDLCRFRLAVHGIDREQALQALRAETKSAQASLRYRRALKLNILLGKLLHVSGQQRLAMRTIRDALQIASREGLVRAFLDEGAPILDLLREIRVARRVSSDMEQNNELDGFIDRILARAGFNVDLAPPDDAFVDASATLTSRELQILESLSLGLSNIAIAKKLFVTETTVRSHLRKINVKLSAGNRTQAVSIGRRLGLIK